MINHFSKLLLVTYIVIIPVCHELDDVYIIVVAIF